MAQAFRFPNKLIEGIIKSRPNRFVMWVEVAGHLYRCFCPTNGTIGNIVFEHTPCLVSPNSCRNGTTAYTVEAIALEPVSSKWKTWIGINQSAANTYLEYFLKTGQLQQILYVSQPLEREICIGKSRLDFRCGNTLLEAKTSLVDLPQQSHLKYTALGTYTAVQRLKKHFQQLARQAGRGKRAIGILCYLYGTSATAAKAQALSTNRIKAIIAPALKKGVELWQVNMRITKTHVRLSACNRLTP